MENVDLSGFFITRDQMQNFVDGLSSISEGVYEKDFNIEVFLNRHLGILKGSNFLSYLKNNSVNLTDTQGIKLFIDKFIQDVSTLPQVAITIAFEPDDSLLHNLSDWFLSNIKKQAVFDVKIDKSIVAGVIIFYNGKYFDYSVKKTFLTIGNTAVPQKPVTQVAPAQPQHVPEHILVVP